MRPPQEKLYPEDMRARFAAGTKAAVDAVRGKMERTEWVRQAVAEKLERAKAPPSVPEIPDNSPPNPVNELNTPSIDQMRPVQSVEPQAPKRAQPLAAPHDRIAYLFEAD